MIKLARSSENPILTPNPNHPWEDMLVYNPAAVMHNDEFYVIYRAQNKTNPASVFGLARSKDGIHFTTQEQPIYFARENKFKKYGIEDPRVVKIEDTYYFVYTIVTEDKKGKIDPKWPEKVVKVPHIGMSSTKDFKVFTDYGVILPNLIGKDASLFPKKVNDEFWLLYREKEGITYFTRSKDLQTWYDPKPVFDKRPDSWDIERVGIGTQPIETEKGWLLFYHGFSNDKVYKVGILFLDLLDPTKVLYRSNEPIFEPEKDFEKDGFVPNVVFPCGAIEKDGLYYIYYGAADETIGLATIEKNIVLSLL